MISRQRRLKERQGRGGVPTISSREINPGKCGSGGAESGWSPAAAERCGAATSQAGSARSVLEVAAATERKRGRQIGRGGAGASVSFPAASAVPLREPPGADSNNPPEQGGEGVDAGDGAAAAGQRGGRSRGRRGAVLLSQSSCAWSDQAAKE